ncbi:MAG: Mth938-like domain-containing protein [Gammaproteobacteria bacterium]|nr:Mth938-like domain-containing protein [Gammaproteobacteria bacterium]
MELDSFPDGKYRIDSYKKGLISINGIKYSSSLIITPAQLIPDWPPQRFTDLATQHIEQITALAPEIIIIGTGNKICFLPPELVSLIGNLNIGVEVMDTGAACRCYNLLIGEGREVAAGLIVIED